MGSLRSKVFIIAIAVFAVGLAETALAQAQIPSIMVDVDKNGVPIIAKDSHARSKRPEKEDLQSKQAKRSRNIPKGSSGYVEPIPLNTRRASGITAPPLVTPYNPPAINNPSERINQLNQSFPLNGGLGNNPTNRDAYIRYNLNR